MKICVIPARGGSKRIPRKNIKEFNGKPVIGYPIQAALKSGLFDKVVVSTDDEEIAKIAKDYGAEVPFIRPEHLSCDHAATAPVILHATEWFSQNGVEVDEVTILYPVNPFITDSILKEAYLNWDKDKFSYCFGVCEFESLPQRAMFISDNGGVESFYPEHALTRTQDLALAFYDAGMFYFTKTQALKEGLQMHTPVAQPYFLQRHLVHDIDTPEDWDFAEKMYSVVYQVQIKK